MYSGDFVPDHFVSIFDVKIWIQWRKETLLNTHFDTIKLSKIQNKNKKKKNTRKTDRKSTRLNSSHT